MLNKIKSLFIKKNNILCYEVRTQLELLNLRNIFLEKEKKLYNRFLDEKELILSNIEDKKDDYYIETYLTILEKYYKLLKNLCEVYEYKYITNCKFYRFYISESKKYNLKNEKIIARRNSSKRVKIAEDILQKYTEKEIKEIIYNMYNEIKINTSNIQFAINMTLNNNCNNKKNKEINLKRSFFYEYEYILLKIYEMLIIIEPKMYINYFNKLYKNNDNIIEISSIEEFNLIDYNGNSLKINNQVINNYIRLIKNI